MIKEHISASASIGLADFDYAPFSQKGGLVKAYNVFEQELHRVLQELNEALVA